MPVRIIGIDHVQVAAPRGCEAEARAFYGDLLGLEEIPKPQELAAQAGKALTVEPAELLEQYAATL